MPVLFVSEDECRAPGAEIASRLGAALGDRPARAPVTLLVHGFRYDAADKTRDPRRLIYQTGPDAGRQRGRTISWTRPLGLSGADSGLAIGFCWRATGTIWTAYDRAAAAGAALARAISVLHGAAPDRAINIFAHSLGARVALRALAHLPPGAVDRMILMSAAEFRSRAERALTVAAGAPEVLNVTGRENALFDLLLRAAFPHLGPTLGTGGPVRAGWADLPMDRDDCTGALAAMGYRLRPYRARVCHWSGYLRPGAFALYRDVLEGRVAPSTLAWTVDRPPWQMPDPDFQPAAP